MKEKQVLKNAVMAVLQTLVLGAILFIFYRYLLRTIGAEQLGIWSLVLASTSVTRVANLGLSGSVVKFVAKYLAHGDSQAVSKVIQTTLISVGLLAGVALLVLYPFAPKLLSLVLEPTAMSDALLVLPYAFASVWLSLLYMVYVGALDGFQRVDFRSYIMMAGALLQAVLAVILVQQLNLVGLALSQVMQYLFLFFASFLVLRRYLYLPLIPYQWDRNLFREMLGYGANFQVISIVSLFYDPVTKALLARFGGLDVLGYYEMASRLVLQVRGLIVAANQVLVPTIADLQERTPEDVECIYANSVRAVTFVTIPMFTVLIVASPAISIAWIGNREFAFIFSVCALSIGWAVNTLSAPAYFAYLGIGTLHWNTIDHLLMGMLNLVFGLFLGIIFGGIGVLVGWIIALIAGSMLLIMAYAFEHGGSRRVYLTSFNLWLMLGVLLSVASAFLVYLHAAQLSWYSQLIAAGSLFLVFMFIPVWIHPVRRQLFTVFTDYFVHSPQT